MFSCLSTSSLVWRSLWYFWFISGSLSLFTSSLSNFLNCLMSLHHSRLIFAFTSLWSVIVERLPGDLKSKKRFWCIYRLCNDKVYLVSISISLYCSINAVHAPCYFVSFFLFENRVSKCPKHAAHLFVSNLQKFWKFTVSSISHLGDIKEVSYKD